MCAATRLGERWAQLARLLVAVVRDRLAEARRARTLAGLLAPVADAAGLLAPVADAASLLAPVAAVLARVADAASLLAHRALDQ